MHLGFVACSWLVVGLLLTPKNVPMALFSGSRILTLAIASGSDAPVRWTLLGHVLGLRFTAPIICVPAVQK